MTARLRTPEAASIHQLAAMLSVQSLDLRAEYEAKLRILTEIQRQIETLRSESATASQQKRTLAELRRRFSELTAANRDASEALKLVRNELDKFQRNDPRQRVATPA